MYVHTTLGYVRVASSGVKCATQADGRRAHLAEYPGAFVSEIIKRGTSNCSHFALITCIKGLSYGLSCVVPICQATDLCLGIQLAGISWVLQERK